MAAQPATFQPVMRRGDDAFLLMSTSGTTGLPKGLNVPINALPAFEAYMRYCLDVRPDDVFWNIADPGWAYGLYYAVTVAVGCWAIRPFSTRDRSRWTAPPRSSPGSA